MSGDPVMRRLIDANPACDIRPHKNYYQELVDSIISQQLSVKAARSIERRFCELFGGTDFPTAEQILKKEVDELRTAGLSRAKAVYVLDLARHVVEGRLEFDRFETMSNEEIAAELTAVKGIGEWTAHMFLMFCMARPDILPVGDLGIRNGVTKLYGLKTQAGADDVWAISRANNWHPYETIASWYVWRSLDNMPGV